MSSLEIERKFLVTNDDWKTQLSTKHPKMFIEQAYVFNEPEMTIRIQYRERYGVDHKASINIKMPRAGLIRNETEHDIDWAKAATIINQLQGKYPVIRKERSFVDINDKMYWEIDEFLNDEIKGLVLAEVELRVPDAKFDMPSWVGEEVTDDPQFCNAMIAERLTKRV